MSLPSRLPRLRVPFTRTSEATGVESTEGAVTPTAVGLTTPSAAPPAGRLNETFRAFRHRNYRLYYGGQVISLSGTWMQTVAQSWLVLQITDSKEALGVVTMLQFLPITVFVLFAGVIADRVSNRYFIISSRCQAL